MSWEWLDETKIIKKCEYTDFTNLEMIVPENVESFFSGNGDRLEFSFNGREFPIYIRKESSRMELKLSKVMVRKLAEDFPEYETFFVKENNNVPKLLFAKNDDKIFLSLVKDEEKLKVDHFNDQLGDDIPAGPAGNGLSRKLKEWIDEYPNFYPRDFRFSFKEVISEEIPEIITTIPEFYNGGFQVHGFAGDSEWAEIPWIAVKKESDLDSGLSLVYCLAKDSQILYLAILYKEDGAGVGSLSERVSELREKVPKNGVKSQRNEIYLADPLLVSGFVYYKDYENDVPDDAALVKDFRDMLAIYEEILERKDQPVHSSPVELPVDAPDEDKNISSELESDLSDGKTPEDKNDFLDESNDRNESEESDVGKGINIDFDVRLDSGKEKKVSTENDSSDQVQEPVELVMEEAQIEKANAEIQKDNFNEDKNEDVEGLSSNKGLESEKKFVQERPAAFNQNTSKRREPMMERKIPSDPIDLVRHLQLSAKSENNFKMPVLLQTVMDKMGGRGFYFPDRFIVDYYLSLKAKPFLIIRGRAGTGKTSFPRLFAEAIGASYDNGRYERVLVSKDWEDEKQILRSFDQRGSFIASPIVRMIKKAMDDPGMPHFLMLDEMDQAKDMTCYRLLLEGINGRDEALLERDDFLSDNGAYREFGGLIFPDNLYIIGSLRDPQRCSAALLDSGNLLEMPEVAINAFPTGGEIRDDRIWSNQQFKMNSPIPRLPEIIEKLMVSLTTIQDLLLDYRTGMGYRQKNEVLAFGINSGIEELFSEADCIDLALTQRLIPWVEEENQVGEVFFRELCLLAVNGKPTFEEAIKSNLLGLSEDDFYVVMKYWEENHYFIWPKTASYLIKRNKK
ncbi:DUF3578 domain-containing protein [Eubacteriaceae bacterium ES3]|nr:DUF3578 domain-containing protein [Eubacteriaceae bacterium ES3]